MKEKNSISKRMESFSEKIAGPLEAFANLPVIQVLMKSMFAITPVIIIGSMFLLLSILGTSYNDAPPILPFMAAWVDKILVVFNLTVGVIALYLSIMLGVNYAEYHGLDVKGTTVISILSFLLITADMEGTSNMGVSGFSTAGFFAAIFTCFIAMRIYRFCIEKNIIIKMPDSVPPAIGKSFATLIPLVFVVIFAWGFHVVIGFDVLGFMTTILMPLAAKAETVFSACAEVFLAMLFWSVGMHGDSLVEPIFTPVSTNFLVENANAFAAGVPATELPHVWCGIWWCVWLSAGWGLVFWLFRSKVKYHRTFVKTVIPTGIFNIWEPLIFGLPMILNPYIMIPMIIAPVASMAFTYMCASLGFINRAFVNVPWVTPAPIRAFLATGGDWRVLVVAAIVFVMSVFIYWPFFKAYEKAELKKEQENGATEELV